MNYTIRNNCLICNNKLKNTYFPSDKRIPIATYCIDPLLNINEVLIPYNIYKCDKCLTTQTKYLGNLNEIYKYNHADGTGIIMKNLHNKVADLIKKYRSKINNIIEIGSSKGILSDIILSKLKNIKYYIIDPNYIGSLNNYKIIFNDFYENIDDNKLNANTLIISHVFEHFYDPIKILQKINDNKNIKNFFLVWPDLDYYTENNILHVLNTEHTFYISNHNLLELIKSFSFILIEEYDYLGHSKIFYFEKIEDNHKYISNYIDYIDNNNIYLYFTNINNTINKVNSIINNTNKNVYIWPCSIHTIFLIVFGLNINKITNFLDNSPLKINKKLYGYNKICLSFEEYIKKNEDSIIIINGGIFNIEIEQQLKKYNNIKVINCSI